jgi:hypothetical protein
MSCAGAVGVPPRRDLTALMVRGVRRPGGTWLERPSLG